MKNTSLLLIIRKIKTKRTPIFIIALTYWNKPSAFSHGVELDILFFPELLHYYFYYQIKATDQFPFGVKRLEWNSGLSEITKGKIDSILNLLASCTLKRNKPNAINALVNYRTIFSQWRTTELKETAGKQKVMLMIATGQAQTQKYYWTSKFPLITI